MHEAQTGLGQWMVFLECEHRHGGALLGGNFKLAGQAQRFLSAHDQINNLFHLRRDHVTAAEHRATRSRSFHL
jgi:hypothetical protein